MENCDMCNGSGIHYTLTDPTYTPYLCCITSMCINCKGTGEIK